MILLVHPHKEGLGIVMEDSTSLWPVVLESARLKILVSSLEEEVIGNKLLSVGLSHGGERVVGSLELSIEGSEGSGNLLLNFSSLLGSHAGSKWIVSQVTGNSDSGGVDHSVLFSWEVWAVEKGVVHLADVFGILTVTVVHLDDLVEKWSEGVESLVASGVDTDS